jgi:beta-galactosidase
MKLRFCIILLGLLISATFAAAEPRNTLSFDAGWRFFKGDAPGAEAVGYEDSDWRQIDVPHDWSIEGPFAAKNPTGPGGGFLPAGIGWYRKHFELPGEYAGRCIFIEFDGVMANSDVWINGFHLGRRPYGYVSFGYELTGKLRFGSDKTNILSVRADNAYQPASRWYTGAGIYRHVRLVVKDPVHFTKWETFITIPHIAKTQATVRVRGAIANKSKKAAEAAVKIAIISPEGMIAGTAKTRTLEIPMGGMVDFLEDFAVSNPRLWQLDQPDLYTARLAIHSADTVLDDETLSFGIRDARFLAETGFWLNGKNLKIKGVCLHHDGGAFGCAGWESTPSVRHTIHRHRSSSTCAIAWDFW